jgi:Protein of unknown function (DUF3574)
MPHTVQEDSLMLRDRRRVLGLLALTLTVLTSGGLDARSGGDAAKGLEARIQTQTQTQAQDRPVVRRRIPPAARRGASRFVRTELFFGTAKPIGAVTEEEFRAFVDAEVTPRFPDGLTVIKGDGQFRGEDEVLVKEQSFVLILLYPPDGFVTSSREIDRIRELYKEQFAQESVLRVDDPFLVWVSF